MHSKGDRERLRNRACACQHLNVLFQPLQERLTKLLLWQPGDMLGSAWKTFLFAQQTDTAGRLLLMVTSVDGKETPPITAADLNQTRPLMTPSTAHCLLPACHESLLHTHTHTHKHITSAEQTGTDSQMFIQIKQVPGTFKLNFQQPCYPC